MTPAEAHAAAAAEGLTLLCGENATGFKGVHRRQDGKSKPFMAGLKHAGETGVCRGEAVCEGLIAKTDKDTRVYEGIVKRVTWPRRRFGIHRRVVAPAVPPSLPDSLSVPLPRWHQHVRVKSTATSAASAFRQGAAPAAGRQACD